MRKYIINNLQPLLIGFVTAMLFIYTFNTISDIIIKIAILNNEN